uniref:carbamoyl phosphate synthase small subunit n=1 Tax=Atlantibacter hermannii TaxID=565 RepID=UPI002896B981
VGDNLDAALALEKAKSFPCLNGMDLAKEVTTREPYRWTQGSWELKNGLPEAKTDEELPFHVVAYDYGVKRNILRMLVDRGCRLTVVPAQTPAADVLKMNPDGIFLSNGPGDPAPCDYAIDAIKTFLDTDIPVFGICLGHQLLALASGAKTVKMKFGHHGGNHPVKNIENNTVLITAQNHGFAVDEATLPATLRVTHKSLFDGTLQGIHRTDKAAFSFQGHPEASPGPHDAAPLFDHFIELIEQYRKNAK